MTLSIQHQLNLLQDILDDHRSAGTGSIAEYQQLMRAAKSIISKESTLDNSLIEQLYEIYHYGQAGENAQNQAAHISEHHDMISSWVNTISDSELK